MSKWVQEQLEEYKGDYEFQTEMLVLEITDQITNAMDALGMKRSELAGRLRVSKPWVTQFLGGNPNVTLKTLCKIAMAIGLDMSVQLALPTMQQSPIPLFERHLQPPSEGLMHDESAIAA